MTNKYREYFDINEKYFPCIDDAAIDDGAPWDNTYPHSTFINMLNEVERALSRQNNGKSLWIEGAYGTGKSQCAYALRKILEIPEDELRGYWEKYDSLKSKTDLLEKIIGHKKKGIVVAYKYAAGGIMAPRDLFFAIQESVKAALIQQNVTYLGENTLKESVIAWLEDSDHKLMFDSLLKNPNKEWSATFPQSNSDEVLDALRKNSDVKNLVDKIFRLADKEGITALSIDSDRLISWITDVIDKNNIKIVLVWDEFSDYFKNNRESLSEFQKVVALVQHKPFYFIVVTHEPQQIYISENDRGNQSKVSDRFVSIPIVLPDNIAFDLIGHAFSIKSAAQSDWDKLVDGDLSAQTSDARTAVMKTANITNHQVMKDIMPIHPMTALLLKNIASAFKSNQRSMFDFIKTSSDENVKAFQWFIDNTGPFDNHPLLTVDMLWDFFYEKGKNNLTPDIRLILDTYSQQQNLREDEQSVLKAILIMQAIDQRLGGSIDLFKATEQNLSYVFAGISSGLDVSCKNLAKQLKEKGVLVANPISGGRYAYAAAVLAGDQAKIDKLKNDIRQSSTTAKLVNEGGLSTVLPLSPALRLRFETEVGTGKIETVTSLDFTRKLNTMREKTTKWKFQAVLALAKDELEAAAFRKTIKTAAADPLNKNITFIDALSSPLGLEEFERYVDNSAMAMYYSSNNNQSSRESADKAKQILAQEWKNRIYNGQFIIYSSLNPEGEKHANGLGVMSVLQTIVMSRFPYTFDFSKNLTETQLKLYQPGTAAKMSITGKISGFISGAEKNVLGSVWGVEEYWKNPTTVSLPISQIKMQLDERINNAFSDDDHNGQIAIGEIYGFLEETFGFAPCSISAFITGFLLKEYGREPFRYTDSVNGHEPMTADKLSEMIGNFIGKNPKPTYIVKMTPEEKAFYETTEIAWDIPVDSCASIGHASMSISKKMRNLKLPVWTLEELDDTGAFNVVKKYIEFVKSEGAKAHTIATEIGKIALNRPSLAENLSSLLKAENCRNGMLKHLEKFKNRLLLELAKEINAEHNLLSDVSKLFEVKHSCLWDNETGDYEIAKLIVEYSFIKQSNQILNCTVSNLANAEQAWREQLKFIGISYELFREKNSEIAPIFDSLLKIYNHEEILSEQWKLLSSNLELHIDKLKKLFINDAQLFETVYQPYLDDLSSNDIAEIKSKLETGLFAMSKTECNIKVKNAAEEFKKSQLKSQLFRIWKEKTGTKNPLEWSERYKTPILCCISENDYEQAKRAFDVLNRNAGTDAEIISAIDLLESTDMFDTLSDSKKRDDAFKNMIVGEYSILLKDIDKIKDNLERFSIDIYSWYGNPSINNRIKQLAEAEYNAGGSDRALSEIDGMSDAELKRYLKSLVKNSIAVGMEILLNEREE